MTWENKINFLGSTSPLPPSQCTIKPLEERITPPPAFFDQQTICYSQSNVCCFYFIDFSFKWENITHVQKYMQFAGVQLTELSPSKHTCVITIQVGQLPQPGEGPSAPSLSVTPTPPTFSLNVASETVDC